MLRPIASLLVVGLLAVPAGAQVFITEFMSEGQGLTGPGTGANRQREFFELTNLGAAPVDISAWSYNDNNANDPHAFGAMFGTIAAGESIVLTQMAVADFRSYWQLPTTVRIFSYGQLSNLGNADTINIYNSAVQGVSTLVDSLTYTSDLRGSGVSRNRPLTATGATVNADWIDSAVGDVFGSVAAPNPVFPPGAEYIDVGNPGQFAAIPEPSALSLLVVPGVLLRRRRR